MPKRFVAEEIVYDVGNKYIQALDSFTPNNVYVATTHDGRSKGVRMEDYACIESSLNPRDNQNTLLTVVCDGHGSIPVYSPSKVPEEATRYVGGFEIAVLTCKSISQYIKRVADYLSFGELTKDGIAKIVYDAFNYAQLRCEEESMRGARMPNTSIPYSEDRLLELTKSLVDGDYFDDLYMKGMIAKNPWIDDRCLVVDKVLVPYGPGYLTYYHSGGDGRYVLAEYGTTATVALFVPSPTLPDRGTVYIGHAGDTDAYLFTREEDGTYTPIKLTGNHTIYNEEEVKRLHPHSMTVRSPYFTLTHGPCVGQSLMPSRSLGHTLLSKHGITFEPTVTACPMTHGDVVVIATDGLWSTYGKVKASTCHPTSKFQPQSDEDISALFVADILTKCPSDSVGFRIKEDLVNTVDKRDNVAIVVVKL
jgi:serine/threonine protein phosphatase PrpC